MRRIPALCMHAATHCHARSSPRKRGPSLDSRIRGNERRKQRTSSLPDLIRQSMRHLSMDHRVKPGGDERRRVMAGLVPAIHVFL